jgi:hypothetical protein
MDIYKPIEDEDDIDGIFREKFGYREFAMCKGCGSTPCDGSCVINVGDILSGAALLGVFVGCVAATWYVLSESVKTGPVMDVPGYVAPRCLRCE